MPAGRARSERNHMIRQGGFVYLTAAEMAEEDRVAFEEFGIEVVALMENAGLATASLVRSILGGQVSGSEVCILVGKGNNGGDGLVAARRLRNWGVQVKVVLGGDARDLRGVPGRQLPAVERMGIEVTGPDGTFGRAKLLVDALLGYGARGDPREPVASLIRRANASGIPVLAVDVPSGLDATSGEPRVPCIVARTTVTFGFPKTGFLSPRSKAYVGELYLADISLPSKPGEAQASSGAFARDSLVKIW